MPIPTLVAQLFLTLTLPVGLGMWVRRRWPDRARRYHPVAQRLAFIGVGLMLLLIVLERSASLCRRLADDGSARGRVHRGLRGSRLAGGGGW